MRIKIKTTLTITLGIVLIAGIAVVGWKHFHSNTIASSNQGKKINSVNYKPPTQAEKQAGDQVKKESIQNSSSGPSDSSSQSTTITISRLAQVSPGQNVNLRTTLSNDVSGGQCVATFTQAGKPSVTQTTGIASNPSYYSCEPIDVSPSQFAGGGTWQVSVYVQQTGSTVSNTATGSITVQP